MLFALGGFGLALDLLVLVTDRLLVDAVIAEVLLVAGVASMQR